MEPAGEPTVVAAPGIVVDVASTADGTVRWSVANDAPIAVSVDRVTLRWRVRTNGRVRVYRHGYQSWSATGTAVLGTAEDPSRTPGSIGLVRNVHHADAAIAPAGELRSELVTVLADDDGALLFGFEGGAHHDGTFRVRAVGDGVVEVDAEAYLGGACARVALDADAAPDPRRDRRPGRRARTVGRLGGRSRARTDADAVPSRLVLVVPVLPRRHRARHPHQPRARERLADRRVPARRRLPIRDRRLARPQGHVSGIARRTRRATSTPRASCPGSGSRRSSRRPARASRNRILIGFRTTRAGASWSGS